jgi:hypothetical protein
MTPPIGLARELSIDLLYVSENNLHSHRHNLEPYPPPPDTMFHSVFRCPKDGGDGIDVCKGVSGTATWWLKREV